MSQRALVWNAAVPDAKAVACTCRHGDVPAEIAWQRPLLARAAAGDAAAFAELFDVHVEGVWRYLLAWTGDREQAGELTEQVFRSALARLEAITGDEGDLGVWLIGTARDAVLQRRAAGWPAGPAEGRAAPAGDALAAVALLGDPEREVALLRLLLGHSLAHTAHLSGHGQQAVKDLQLTACLTLWELTGGPRSGHPGEADQRRADEFERRLARWAVDLSGDDPGLADALAVVSSLRLAAPRRITAPEHGLLERLRERLVAAARERPEPPPAAGAARRAWRGLAALRLGPAGRPWLLTAVAATATVAILAVQALGRQPPPSPCGDRPCLAVTTAAATAGPLLAAPTSIVPRRATTTAPPPSTSPPQVAATLPPPTTRPATTARPTTNRAPTTTRRATSTTAASTTSEGTTTTGG
jgi:RNA polymerase sigma-70 factor, ECF subfamily